MNGGICVPKIDVTDEAVINAPPSAVYKAFIEEVAGKTHWWMPALAFHLKGDVPMGQEGAVFDIIAHPESRMKAKFSCRLRKVEEAKRVEVDIFAGDCIGNGLWTFQEVDGKTKVAIRFNVRTNNVLVSLFSPFVDLAKNHSEAIQHGYRACNSYLCEK